jgi:Fibronectin type III domain/Glycosyl hydrolases family 16
MKVFVHLLVSVILLLAGMVVLGVRALSHPAGADSSADPSGQPMPVGDLPGWHQIFADNFANDSYPLGSFTGCRQTGCAGTPGLPWGAVSDGHPDTSGNCAYDPSKTLSITGGLMNIALHTDPDGTCMDASVYPLAPAVNYGMYSVRFRSDTVLGYKGVFLLWPVNQASGEVDFPEANLENAIHGFLHTYAGGPEFQTFISNASWNDWHTATLQWTPYGVTFILDGTALGTTYLDVPQNPMTLALRGESDLQGAPKPPASSQGNLQIDWATIYTYAGNPNAISVGPAALGQGTSNATLNVTGSGFTSDAKVSFSSPDIVTTGPPTLVTPNLLHVPVHVAQSAALASSDVTVTEPSTSWSCSGCVTVGPGPSATSVSPAAVVGQTGSVTINGSNLGSGLTLSTTAIGVKFGTPTSQTSGSLTVPVTATHNAPAGAYDLTVTNPDHGSTTCTGCLDVITTPSAPVIEDATVGNGLATVSFSPPPTDGGSPVSTYSATALDVTNPVNGGQTTTGTGTSLTVPGLVNGDRYRFQVSATNVVGTGPNSTLGDTVVPATVAGAPVIGTATAGNSRAIVNFQPPYADGGVAVTGYSVAAIDSTNAANGGQVQTVWRSPVTITGLTNGDSYQFSVRATNVVGNSPVSALSNPVVPATLAGPPVSVTATPGDSTAVVAFSPPTSDGGSAIIGYRVTATDASRPANGGQVQTVSGSPATMSGLTNGGHYKFNVDAVTGVGYGHNSARSNSVVPSTVPGAPVVGTATESNAKATVTFRAPTSDGGRALMRYTVTALDDTTPANGGQTKTAWPGPVTVTGLTNGDAYQFVVTATNAVGSGAESDRSNTVVPATLPGAPVVGTVAVGNFTATVSFGPPVSDGGSAVTEYTVSAVDTSHQANGHQVAMGPGGPITVPGLVNGDRYRFVVSATTGVGTGRDSAMSSPVIPMTVPGAPVIRTVTPGKTDATISFLPPSWNGGSTISWYVVTAIDDTNPANGRQLKEAGKSPVTIDGLTTGDTYQLTVSAINAAGSGPTTAPSKPVVPT